MLVLIRELESHIDDDDLVSVLESHTVETYLLQSPERDNTERVFFYRLRSKLDRIVLLADRLFRRGERERFLVPLIYRKEIARAWEELLVALILAHSSEELLPGISRCGMLWSSTFSTGLLVRRWLWVMRFLTLGGTGSIATIPPIGRMSARLSTLEVGDGSIAFRLSRSIMRITIVPAVVWCMCI